MKYVNSNEKTIKFGDIGKNVKLGNKKEKIL